MDLAGLTFESLPPTTASHPPAQPQQLSEYETLIGDTDTSNSTGIWQTTAGLVDLDLSGRSKPIANTSMASLNSLLEAKPFAVSAATHHQPQQSLQDDPLLGQLLQPRRVPPSDPFASSSFTALSHHPLPQHPHSLPFSATAMGPPMHAPTGTGLTPLPFPPPLPGSTHGAASLLAPQPPVYGRGLMNSSPPPLAAGPMMGIMQNPVPPVYGTGLANGGMGNVGGMMRPMGMGNNSMGAGMGPNTFGNSMGMNNNVMGGSKGMVGGAMGGSSNGMGMGSHSNIATHRSSGNSNNTTIKTVNPTTTNNPNNVLTFNGLGIIPSPTKTAAPSKSSLDSLNWRG